MTFVCRVLRWLLFNASMIGSCASVTISPAVIGRSRFTCLRHRSAPDATQWRATQSNTQCFHSHGESACAA